MSSSLIASLLEKASHYQQQGRVKEAVSTLEMILANNPQNKEALARLGVAYLELNRAGLAEKTLRRLVNLQPNYANGWKALGSALGMQFRFAEAADAFKKARHLQPDNLKVLAGEAQMLLRAGRYRAAAKAYEDVLLIDKTNLSALLGLGHARRALGEDKEAVSAYRKATTIEPRFGQAWWSIANLKTNSFTEADSVAMKRAEAVMEKGEAQAAVQFSLAKAYEDAGETDRAFAQYLIANKTARGIISYDAQADENYVRRIEMVFPKSLFKIMAGAGCDYSGPIFVVGMPRSGSTLVEQILASHSAVEGLGELPSLGQCSALLDRKGDLFPEVLKKALPDDLQALGEKYFELTKPYRSGQTFFVDKMPNNFFLIGLIALILPNAIIIDARRHPMDSCVSSFRQFFAKGQSFSYALDDLARYYRLYDRLMKHWNCVLPGRVLRVDYEALVLDQDKQTKQLLAHCGLSFEEQCLRFHETKRAVGTASSEQVRKPLYRSGLQSWRRYEKHLSELQHALRDVLVDTPDIVKTAGV